MTTRTYTVGGAGTSATAALPDVADGATVAYLATSGPTVWLAPNSNTAPGAAVPLPPGGTYTKNGAGTLYAILDPKAATGSTATLVVSDELNNPTDPVGAAAAAAAAAFLNGVPNVITQKIITQNLFVAAGTTKTYDVSGYSSITVTLTNGAGLAVREQTYQFLDPAGGLVDEDQLYYAGRLAVSAGTFVLIANVNLRLTIVGTNRPALKRKDVTLDAAAGDQWYLDQGGAYSSGANVMSQRLPSASGAVSGPALQGAVSASFLWNPGDAGASSTARFELIVGSNNPYTVAIADTSEFVASLGSGVRIITKTLALPATFYKIQVRTATSASTGAQASVAFIPHT